MKIKRRFVCVGKSEFKGHREVSLEEKLRKQDKHSIPSEFRFGNLTKAEFDSFEIDEEYFVETSGIIKDGHCGG